MWELDHKGSWTPKNWCLWTRVLEKTLESPLDHKEIQPVHPKGNQSWIFIGRTDAEVEALILWPHDVKSWQEKTLMVGKTEGRRRRGWQRMRWLDGITDSMDMFEQTLGDSERQGNLVCCHPREWKEWDTTEWLNWTELRCSVGLPSWLRGKEPTCQCRRWRDKVWSLGWEDPGVRVVRPLQCSCLINSMDWGAWQATVHGLTKESPLSD